MTRLLIRADGNAQIGYGHLMRCLALANGGSINQIIWFSKDEISDLLNELSTVCIDFVLLSHESNFLANLKPTDLVLLDHYSYGLNEHEQIQKTGATLVLIDDLADQPISADIIINPSPGVYPQDYNVALVPIFLLGTDFALLRQPFIELAQQKKTTKVKDSVLICMGGADPLNLTSQVLATCIEEPFTKIHIVVGGAYQHADPAKSYNDPRIKIHRNLNAQEMAALMQDCEFGIYPASGILLEGLAAQQVIIMGLTAENQSKVYEGHLALNSVIDGGKLSATQLKQAFQKLSVFEMNTPLLDGHSIQRIWRTLARFVSFSSYRLRLAQRADLLTTFEWAQEPMVRRFSHQQHEISLEEHTNWFEQKINDPNCFFYLMENGELTLGSIRFDFHGSVSQISYLLGPAAQGKGLGLFLLKKGLEQILAEKNCPNFDYFLGEVLPENQPSIRIFEQLGFALTQDPQVLRFTRKRHTNV
jgi:UDP-2,4-diacetamido-2,4,6-trideoxy-beta-L-altropyranose hydrolase